MRADTGVKKAIAVRLRLVLEDEIRSYMIAKNNPYYLNSVSPTQFKRFERGAKKIINALRIVIHKLDPKGPKQPAWYDVIGMTDVPEEPPPLKRY